MEKRILEIKHMARNADKSDLRHVIQELAEALLDVYKSQNATPKQKKTVSKKRPKKSTKAKPVTLADK